MRGIQKVLRQILKNTLFMKFTKLFRPGIFQWKHRLQKCYELDGN